MVGTWWLVQSNPEPASNPTWGQNFEKHIHLKPDQSTAKPDPTTA